MENQADTVNTTNQILFTGYEITGESWLAWTRGLQIIERARAGLVGEEVTPYTEEEYIQHLDNCLDKVLDPDDDTYAIVRAETVGVNGLEWRLVFVCKNPNATRAGLLELLQVAASRQLRLSEYARIFFLQVGEDSVERWIEKKGVGETQRGGSDVNNLNSNLPESIVQWVNARML